MTFGATALSLVTSRFRPLASFWRETSTASAVATTTRSSTPSSATSAESVVTLQLRLSSNTALPCEALPCASFSDNSHTACQEPTSDQPQDTGTTAARAVFSITA
ncbi:hypothetical protein ACVWW4_008095 [Bradyrhizobium sp. LB7.1]